MPPGSSLHILPPQQPDVIALVLAGGRGSRLMELTRRCAKPALPFGGRFRHIDFTLSNCVNSEINRIGVLTQYQPQPLVQHILQGWNTSYGPHEKPIKLLPPKVPITDGGYSGTANAVYQNLDLLLSHKARYTLILAGDHIYAMDYRKMLAEHIAAGADATVACTQVPVQQASEFGVMGIDGQNEIQVFAEKPSTPSTIPGQPGQCLVSMGIYLFNTEVLRSALRQDAANWNSSHDFGHDVIPALINSRHQTLAYRFSDPDTGEPCYWRDIGNLDAYWQANMDLLQAPPALDLFNRDWPIHCCRDQSSPVRLINDACGRQGIATASLVSAGCIIQGAEVVQSVLCPGVAVQSGSKLNECVVLPNASIGRNCYLNRVIVDQGCLVPDGTCINGGPEGARLFQCQTSPGGIVLATQDRLIMDLQAPQYA